ncbi:MULTISPECIES: APC family permease [Cryobacterium]|uniref:APC family permease n=1 Tax=Cryobacterium TaxID=69578 RepID=UPI0030B831DA
MYRRVGGVSAGLKGHHVRRGFLKKGIGDVDHLKVLGYDDSFHRSMSLWANFALGFTYLSPLVGVYSLFALAMSTGGPPSLFWLFIVGTGQLLVALVFGEVVSKYPIAGGIYPWTRRLWGKRYAWMAAWVYIWAMLVTITAVAEFGTGFLASLINAPATKEVTLGLSIAFLVAAFGLNFSGTKTLARVARIGLAAELIGVVAVGLYLLIFQRHQEFSVFFDSMGVQGNGSYATVFLGAALTGLFLFYGFEACGEMAGQSVAAHRGADQCVDCGVLDSGGAVPDHLRWQRPGPDPVHLVRRHRHLRGIPIRGARCVAPAHQGLEAGRSVQPGPGRFRGQRARPRLRHLCHGAARGAGRKR